MDKYQFLVRPDGRPEPAAFARGVLQTAAERLLPLRPRRLTVTLTARKPPRLSVIPFRRDPVALVSVVGEPGQGPEVWLDALRGLGRVEAYRVEEAVPRAYHRTWAVGERTPGVGLLTLLRRRPGLSDEELERRWFGGHTPLTLEVHPVWCYVRNRVREPLFGAPPLDGIVEEHFAEERDLLSPVRFFGGSLLRMLPTMLRVARDISGFIHLPSIESYLVDEHVLR